ncbi:TIGR03905 family TSCPD domain-containing protein [Romboutsia weinsteinii]|uniref:ribonucleoside-diphosphate reductase n=1 Tax=Romboutsia weinsteinii TaxID=2020949 RepID=A0A371J8P8_9FIRM|nr:TIGR03905 family TSCPD domain-containing protein [Romboutsia weinsteinii]RDY29129.1 TIGR03905 family TSCPD domain-containing protein [Romboutsia weinsteinii]
MKITYQTSGTCCREIILEMDENHIITSIDFIGGCAGNLIGIRNLVVGQKAEDVVSKLENVRCGEKATSCPDQLSKALKKYI